MPGIFAAQQGGFISARKKHHVTEEMKGTHKEKPRPGEEHRNIYRMRKNEILSSFGNRPPGSYALEDLLDLAQLQEMLDILTETIDLTTAILDCEGRILTASGWRDICVKFHRANALSARRCKASDQCVSNRIQAATEPVIHHCPMGLVDSATPIVIDGKHLGNMFIGQFFLEKPDPERFRKQAAEYGFDEDAYLKALANVPVLSPARLQQDLAFIHKFTEILCETGLKRLQAWESERRFRTIYDSVSDAIFMLDPITGTILDVNVPTTLMFGFSREEASAISVTDVSSGYPPFTARQVLKHIRKAAKGILQFFEWHARKADGTLFWIEVTMKKAQFGERPFVLATARDITGRKRLGDELLRRERYQRTLLDNFPYFAWLKDEQSQLLAANLQYARVAKVGSTRELEGKTDFDLFPRELAEKYVTDDQRVMTLGSPMNIEEMYRDENGDLRWMETWKSPVVVNGRIVGTAGCSRDITERRQYEQALRERAELECRQSHFFRVAPGFFFTLIKTPDGNLSMPFASHGLVDLYGLRLDDIAEDLSRFIAMYHPDDIEYVFAALEKSECNLSQYHVEYRINHPEKGLRWIEARSLPQRDRDGGFLWHGFMHDITERKRAENIIHRRAQESLALITNSPNAIARYDRSCRRTYVNPTWERLNGFPAAMVIGKTPIEFSGAIAAVAVEYETRLKKVIATGLPTDFEMPAKMKNGPTVWFLMRAVPEFDREGRVESVLTVANDISDLKRTQDELLKSQKLEWLGIMAGGIAHDFSNILCGVTGYIAMAQQLIKPRSQVAYCLAQAEQDTRRAVEFVQKLLNFSKGGEPVRHRIDPRRILEESLRMAIRQNQVKYSVVIVDDLDNLDADEGQILQVCINIITNAVQAMPNGGAIAIEAANNTPAEIGRAGLADGRYVKIAFTDQGHGIAEEDQQKVFDPFFSRKSGGTGLGLASSYTIVKRHGGTITLSSQVGVGTTFTVYLPSSRATADKTAVLQEPDVTANSR